MKPAGAVEIPRSSRRGEHYAARRSEIVDIAAKLFAANGYAATGIRDIGDAAELARGALYYYIDSKETLLGEIHDRVLDPLLEQADSIARLNLTPMNRLKLISEVLLRLIIDHKDHVWVFLHEYRSLSGERRKTFLTKRGHFENLILDLLDEGAEKGELVVDDRRITMLAFIGMHNYTYQWIHGADASVDAAELSQHYCRYFFDGIATERTRR